MAETAEAPPKLNRAQFQALKDSADRAQAEQAAAPQPAKRDKPIMLDPARMQLAEFLRDEWACTVERGVTLADVLDEAFFSSCAMRLKPYSHIEVRSDDDTWMADLVVISSGRNWARCYAKHFYRLVVDVPATLSNPKIAIRWRGPHLKFCVVRINDDSVLSEKHDREEQAWGWVRAHQEKANA